jgi:hypothetical protein
MIIMPKIDVLDEAIIDSPPMVVYEAILNEYAGVTHWWLPHCELKPRGDMPVDREGAIVDVTIHTSGTPKFSIKMTKIVKAKSMEMEFAGDFVGTGKLTLEPTDGKTKVQYRWNVRPKRLSFVLLSPFIDMGKGHSDTMRIGFKALNSYLSKK